MNDLQDVQALLRSTIAAATVDSVPYFEDGDVIADDGLQLDVIEQRIISRGFAVVCDLPVQAKVVRRAPNVNQCQAVFPVTFEFNPQRITELGSMFGILSTMDVAASALLAYGTNPTDRFECADDAFDLLSNDAGLVKYVLWVFAQINLAATN